MDQTNIYNKDYSVKGLPSDDWLLSRDKIIRRIIKELDIKPTDTVLDLGCDDGFMQSQVARITPDTYGIDVNRDALAMNPNPHTKYMDARHLEFSNEFFDVIYSSHTIEHITDLQGVFHEVSRVLKSGGLAYLVYPWELFRGMAALRTAWKLHKNPLVARAMHVHKLNPKKLLELTAETRLVHIKSALVFLNTPQWVSIFKKQL